MSDLYSGITGNVIEASDIARDLGCTVAESFEYQSMVADLRHQAYLDAIAEIESNVIRVDFVSRTRLEK